MGMCNGSELYYAPGTGLVREDAWTLLELVYFYQVEGIKPGKLNILIVIISY